MANDARPPPEPEAPVAPAEETVVAPEAEAPAEPGPARRRGIRLLKAYAVLYVLLALVYAAHLVTGAAELPAEAARAGMRVWDQVAFTRRGESVEIPAGTTLGPDSARALRMAAATAVGPQTVIVYADGWWHRIPWQGVLSVWNFLGLVLILYTAGGDLVVQMLDDYRQRLRADLDRARAAREEAEALRREHERVRADLEAEEKRLSDQAAREAAEQHERLLRETREDVERMRASLEQHIATEVREATARLRVQLVREIMHEARDRLRETADASTHERMMDRFVTRLKETDLP